ncbi:MAG: histidine phosphatase family protein [Hyphomonadaceae bacterium]|nr:histidine phosphatase family protein [Hyphomonadaceae bacterium]
MHDTARATISDQRAAVAPGWIAIVRHGRPKADRSVRIDWRGYEQWWAAYQEAGLMEDQAPPERLLRLADDAHTLFASTLMRAKETAAAVAAGRAIIEDPIFVEAPLPPPRMFGRRRPGHWGVLARISWWMGGARDEESRTEAELRAEAAVATVTARALRGENVLVCAHGWFNRMMRPVLTRQGWRCAEDHGDSYWTYRLYRKRG